MGKVRSNRVYLSTLSSIFILFFMTSCLTPLMTALTFKNMPKATALIASGADVNKKSMGNTPLSTAVYYNNVAVVRLMISKGADINEVQATKDPGLRPIFTAVERGNAEMVKLLVDSGANISIQNLEKKTPLNVAEEKGYSDIVHILKGEVYSVTDSIKPSPLVAKTVIKEPFITKNCRLVLPIPSYIPNTALSNNGYPSQLEKDNGKISSWGWGFGVEARATNNFRIFSDLSTYFYSQELVEKGGTAHLVGTGTSATFPLGVKYNTQTEALRVGLKYVLTLKKSIQPWVGVGYGINVWNVRYLSWDQDATYGKALGTTFRSSILAGIDFNITDIGTIILSFDAISPVANFTMKNLFNLEDYHQFDAMTFPTPRIGIGFRF